MVEVSRAQEAQRPPRPPFDPTCPNAHDPVMALGEDGRYYCFMTGMNISVLSSADLKEWREEPAVLSQTPQWAIDTVPGYQGHTWAPDISFHNGMWYLYYSCSTFGKNTSAIGLAVNKTLDPKSPNFKWEDKGIVIASVRKKDNWNAIDPNLIVSQDGDPYLIFGSFWDGIQLVELSRDDYQTPVAMPATIARRVDRRLPKSGENAIEAPFVFEHNGYYYLFVSFDYCCKGENSTYRTVYGRSRDIGGPYIDAKGQPMQYGGGTRLYGPDDEYYGIGHCSVYQFNGRCYFVAHGYAKSHRGAAKLFIRPLFFDENGWIVSPYSDEE